MQETMKTGLYKDTGSILKVIQVRSTVKLGDITERYANTYFVIAYNLNGYVHEMHQFNTSVKAQRKFDRLNGLQCHHKRTAPAHDPDMRECLACSRLVPISQLEL